MINKCSAGQGKFRGTPNVDAFRQEHRFLQNWQALRAKPTVFFSQLELETNLFNLKSQGQKWQRLWVKSTVCNKNSTQPSSNSFPRQGLAWNITKQGRWGLNTDHLSHICIMLLWSRLKESFSNESSFAVWIFVSCREVKVKNPILTHNLYHKENSY